MRYRFTCDYKSGAGAWAKGDVVDLDDETAAWLLRDVAGCIVPVTDARAVEAAPHDRQIKAAPKNRSAMSTQDASGITKGGA